jgi:hypothetical protein
VKLPGHRPELPGNVISFYIVLLDPALSAGLAGHFRPTRKTICEYIPFTFMEGCIIGFLN